MNTTEYIILIAEIIGTIAFAISGAMIAIQNKLDIFGVVILGSATAVGGGLLRDILLGHIPASMFINPTYVIIAMITTILVFLVFYILKDLSISTKRWYKKTLNIIDSIGLGVFVVLGANVTFQQGFNNFFLVIFCSTLTAVGGGILRDVLTGKIPAVFRKHIYVLAALPGGIVYYIFHHYNLNINVAIFLCMGIVITIRLLAYKFEWSLPKVSLKQ